MSTDGSSSACRVRHHGRRQTFALLDAHKRPAHRSSPGASSPCVAPPRAALPAIAWAGDPALPPVLASREPVQGAPNATISDPAVAGRVFDFVGRRRARRDAAKTFLRRGLKAALPTRRSMRTAETPTNSRASRRPIAPPYHGDVGTRDSARRRLGMDGVNGAALVAAAAASDEGLLELPTRHKLQSRLLACRRPCSPRGVR